MGNNTPNRPLEPARNAEADVPPLSLPAEQAEDDSSEDTQSGAGGLNRRRGPLAPAQMQLFPQSLILLALPW